MRTSWRTNARLLLLCGVVGVLACPHWSLAGKKIVFSDPSDPQEEMETKQQERAPAATIGSVRTDPIDYMAPSEPMMPRRANKRDSQRDFFNDPSKSDDSKEKDKNKDKERDGLLSPGVKGSSFDKGWSSDSYSSQESWRSSQDSRDDSKGDDKSDFRSRRSASDDFRRTASQDFSDQERASDVLRRQLDRIQGRADTMSRGGGLDSLMRSQVPGMTVAPPDSVSQLHDSLWSRPDDRGGLSSYSSLSDPTPSQPKDNFTSAFSDRPRASSDDFGRSSFSSPGYQSRSFSAPDQPSMPAQRSVFLPVPKSPGSLLK